MTNSVTHSKSGLPGGMVMVHLARAGSRQAVMIVTDQGGDFTPSGQDAVADSETGRGLAVVQAVTSLLVICSQAGLRSFLAVICDPAEPPWPPAS